MQKVVIMGAGFMGETHANGYKLIDNAKVVAVVDRVEEKAKKIAGMFDAKIYTDFDEMLSTEDFDLLDICTPTGTHPWLVKKAAEAKKNILCEKPLALSVEEADAMIEDVKKNGVKAMVGQVLRFWPEYVKVKEIVASGKYGKPLHAYCARLCVPPEWYEGKWGYAEENSGGAVLDLSIHDLDYLLWIFGKPSSLKAQGVYNPELAGLFHVVTGIEFENGGSGVAEGGWGFMGEFPFTMVLRILLEKAVIDWEFRAGKNIEQRDKVANVIIYEEGGKTYNLEAEQKDPYYLECQYFVDCLEKGLPIERATFEDGRKAVEIAIAARESAKGNKIIKF
jgi:predicted dehydrogenase